MAVQIYTAVCAKCEREIGPAHSLQGEIICTPCVLERGTVWSSPKVREPELKTRSFPKPQKLPKRRAKPKTSKAARTDRQRQAGYCAIYAIQMKAGIVKVGRTTNWAARKHQYTNGFDDVIKRSSLFRILDDHEILPDIETALLQSLPHSRAKGFEWLFADFDEIATHTDAFLRNNGIMFEREDAAA